jgi:hypothetical protein
MTYNSKLQPNHFEISGGTVSQSYDYYNDGHISFVHNTADANFDRSYSYDHVGRLIEAKSGGQARNGYGNTPYYESFAYDPFSNLTTRQSDSWNGQTSASDSASYTNNRRAGWGYDTDGRNTAIGTRSNAFDAAGRQTQMTAQQVLWNGNHITVSQTTGYDGDGASVYEVASGVTTYHVRSSALGGQIVEELNNSGQKTVGYVCLPGGQLLATQTSNPSQLVTWKHNTAAGTGEYTMNTYNPGIGRTEFDPSFCQMLCTRESPPEIVHTQHLTKLRGQRPSGTSRRSFARVCARTHIPAQKASPTFRGRSPQRNYLVGRFEDLLSVMVISTMLLTTMPSAEFSCCVPRFKSPFSHSLKPPWTSLAQRCRRSIGDAHRRQ